jgi:hypothetical protein
MNPYSSPESKESSHTKPLNTELRNIVIGWERMRILYNIILFLVGVVAIFVSLQKPFFSLEEVVISAIAFGIFANVCFCAGPTAETYIRVIFNSQDVKTVRLSLFILGTLLSLIPAFMVIAGYLTDAIVFF